MKTKFVHSKKNCKQRATYRNEFLSVVAQLYYCDGFSDGVNMEDEPIVSRCKKMWLIGFSGEPFKFYSLRSVHTVRQRQRLFCHNKGSFTLSDGNGNGKFIFRCECSHWVGASMATSIKIQIHIYVSLLLLLPLPLQNGDPTHSMMTSLQLLLMPSQCEHPPSVCIKPIHEDKNISLPLPLPLPLPSLTVNEP